MTTAKKPSKPTGPSKAKPRPGPNKQKRGSSAVGERLVHTQKVGRSTRPLASSLLSLTPQQAKFVVEYLRDFNATQAALRAGYSPKTARQQGARLLSHVDIQRAIAPKQQEAVAAHAEAINRMELTVDRTKLEIARIAYFDPRKLFGQDGRPLSITELDDDTAAVIAGLEVLEEYEGSGEDRILVGHVKKWKLADKNAALDKASKILGIYEKDNDQKKPDLATQLAGFVGELHQSGAGRMPFANRGPKT